MNQIKKEIRNVKFGGSISKSEMKLFKSLAKKHKISKTELLVRSLKLFDEINSNSNLEKK